MIHPSIVLATQFGDSSRLEPKSVIPRPASDESDFLKVMSETRIAKPEAGKAKSEITYCFDWDPSHEYLLHDSYTYVGSYKNKHIILSCSYDTNGTGRFGFLTTITRNEDSICNAGEIAAGDRAHGGVIKVLSLNKHILRYAQAATTDTIISALLKKDCGVYDPPNAFSGYSLIYQVNLDEPVKDNEYTSLLVGLHLDHDHYKRFYCSELDTLANEYLKQGKKVLSLSEAQNFAQNIEKGLN